MGAASAGVMERLEPPAPRAAGAPGSSANSGSSELREK